MWLMRSPLRLEQVDSPPYIVVKTEDDENQNARAGSKKPDLCAIGGVLMASQVGMDEIKTMMKQKKNRMDNAIKFIRDYKYHYTIRCLVAETYCKPAAPISLEQIHRIFQRFLSETPPGERVPK